MVLGMDDMFFLREKPHENRTSTIAVYSDNVLHGDALRSLPFMVIVLVGLISCHLLRRF